MSNLAAVFIVSALFPLAQSLSPLQLNHQIYSVQQSVPSAGTTASFEDDLFDGCESTDSLPDGGAIYASSETLDLLILRCRFFAVGRTKAVVFTPVLNGFSFLVLLAKIAPLTDLAVSVMWTKKIPPLRPLQTSERLEWLRRLVRPLHFRAIRGDLLFFDIKKCILGCQLELYLEFSDCRRFSL
jgi:hypothetical protein